MVLLYYAGVLRACKLNVKDLWCTDGTGINLFIATMSMKRFSFLSRCVRFDDLHTRAERRKYDKLAAIREISDLFRKNVQENYITGSYATIDEK